MKTLFALCILIALLLPFATAPTTAEKLRSLAPASARAQSVAASQPAAAKGAELATLEHKLLGTWYGPDCGGDYTFNADGTFDVQRFTPGNNTLTGTWSLRWDALPPTLVLTCKTSDFKKKDPTREEYEYLGKPLELKLLELNGDALACWIPSAEWIWHYSRKAETGGHVTRK